MSGVHSSVPVIGVIPIAQMVGGDEEDTKLQNLTACQAHEFLPCFPWCMGIRDFYFGDGYGGVIALFFVRIEPSRSDVDEWLWVVYGRDFPLPTW
jgi:hypothetical protein